MKYLLILLFTVVAAVYAFIGIGAIENYLANPLRDCEPYDGSSEYVRGYTGYRCAENTYYVRN